MRTLQKIDVGIQLAVLVAALFSMWIEPILAAFIYLLGFLLWNTLSIAVHSIYYPIKLTAFVKRRKAILIHLLFIIGVPFVIPYTPHEWHNNVFIIYLLYVFIMPFYYLWMSYSELRLLNEIHDQVDLLDISEH